MVLAGLKARNFWCFILGLGFRVWGLGCLGNSCDWWPKPLRPDDFRLDPGGAQFVLLSKTP